MDNHYWVLKPWQKVAVAIWACLVLLITILFIHRKSQWKDEIIHLVDSSIRGKVSKIHDAKRGLEYIEFINGNPGDTLQYYLEGNLFFRENKVRKNYSISKEAHSRNIIFYHWENGHYTKCCEYEIYL